MSRTVEQHCESVMQVYKCSRRQAMEYLHSDLTPKEFFSDVQLTGYVPFPEDEDIIKDTGDVCTMCGRTKYTSECGCEDNYQY